MRCSFRPDVVNDVISGANVGQIGLDVPVKLGDFIKTVHDIYSSEAVGCSIFACYFNFDNCQPEVVSDVISGMVVEPTCVKVVVKFGDSRSNCSPDI